MSDNQGGKIYITIGYGDASGQGNNGQGKSKDEEKKKDTLNSYIAHKTLDLIKSKTTQAISKSINRIGSFKGDYITMNEVNYAINTAKQIGNYGMAIYGGAMVGGVAGSIAGGVFMFASSVGDYIQDTIDYNFAYNQQQREISLLRQRSGLNGATNESRTGD